MLKSALIIVTMSIAMAQTNVVFAQCCPCDGDLDGNGTVNGADITLLNNCVMLPSACDLCVVPGCDVDCNGLITASDIATVLCMSNAGGGSPNVSCCNLNPAAECGAEQECIDSVCTDVNSIPTTSEWGLVSMLMLIMIVGTFVFKRRVA